MPNRIIREAILSSERMSQLDWSAETFYRRLLSIVDDYGRFECSLSLLRAKCYPIQIDKVREADIARWLTACQKAGLIVLYQAVIGGRVKHFLSVEDFKQQTRSASKCPAPDATQMIAYDEQLKSFAHLGVVVSVVVDVAASQAPADALFDEPPDNSQQAILEFPCKGDPGIWTFTQQKLSEYCSTYPEMDCLFEARRALQWVRDNSGRQKTVGGMPKFLGNWLAKAQNRGDSRLADVPPEEKQGPDMDWMLGQLEKHGSGANT